MAKQTEMSIFFVADMIGAIGPHKKLYQKSNDLENVIKMI